MAVRRSALVRLLAGVAVSVVFLWLTLLRVNLAEAAAAIRQAAPLALAAALGLVLVDLCLRALRWHVLLHNVEGAAVRPPYRLAFGYLTLGFAANFVLPARLGDVARAVLAAGTFRAPRLAIFGTVMIERVSDGLTMLALAILSSLLVVSASELRDLTGYAIVLGVIGLVGASVSWFAFTRTQLRGTRVGLIVNDLIGRVAAGAGALKRPRPALAFLALTIVLAGTATLVAWTVLRAVGVELTPIQTVLFLSGIALSLAIPAAPGALGTYEFVGVAIITGLGYTPEQGLATILLMRVVTTFPPALIGLGAIWALHVRPEDVRDTLPAEPVEPAGSVTGQADG